MRKDRAGSFLDAVLGFLGFIFFLEWVLERPAAQNRELTEKNEQTAKPGKPLSGQQLGKGQSSRNLMPTRVGASARPPPSHRVSDRVRRTQPGSPKLPQIPKARVSRVQWRPLPHTQGNRDLICWPLCHKLGPPPSGRKQPRAGVLFFDVRPNGTRSQAALTGFLELQCHQENEADHSNI